MSPEEAAVKVGRNILTRALGLDGDFKVDVGNTETFRTKIATCSARMALHDMVECTKELRLG
jgi:hypothetical protein